ncbi:MAG: hypothetical protein ACP5NZ_01025 [Nanobdellota archaeon]
MEKENTIKKSLKNKLLVASAVVLGGIAINQGSKIDQIKEITSTYQGYTVDDGKGYLVFDDKKKEAREGFPALVIEGNPDTMKIGEKYTVRYAIKNWENFFPSKIIEVKYAK